MKKTIGKKKSIVILVIILLIVGIIANAIYRHATKDEREKRDAMEDIERDIEGYRKDSDRYFFLFIPDEYREDDEFIDFLCSEIQIMCDNKEYELLHKFVYELICDEHIFNDKFVDIVVNSFMNAPTLEDALAIREAFDKEAHYLSYWEAIEDKMVLNRNLFPVATYIEQNGTRSFTMTPGEGFYAEYENESSHDHVGLPSSPLYDSDSTTYFGDFKRNSWSGVRLNAWYEEEHYGGSNYFFKDKYISFSPNDGECVWSGDYLFCFAPNGELIGYEFLGIE